MKKIIYILLIIYSLSCMSSKDSKIKPPSDVFYVPNCESLKTYYERGQDELYIGMFITNKAELDFFIEKNELFNLINSKERPFSDKYHTSIKWWNPDEGKLFFGGSKRQKEWVSEMIVQHKNDKYIVYYQVYQL